MLRYLPFLLVLALWVYAFVDCLNTPEEEVRHLPKVVWVTVILLFGEVLVGPLAWLITGRVRRGGADGTTAGEGHPDAAARWVAPDDNPEFLKSLGKDDGSADRDEPKRD
ncbi:PLD nuclease N-terminal domain-containing protein [Streptomyces sp. NPDC004561]